MRATSTIAAMTAPTAATRPIALSDRTPTPTPLAQPRPLALPFGEAPKPDPSSAVNSYSPKRSDAPVLAPPRAPFSGLAMPCLGVSYSWEPAPLLRIGPLLARPAAGRAVERAPRRVVGGLLHGAENGPLKGPGEEQAP